jgi:hypothetical protein
VSFAAIALCVASQGVFIVAIIYFIMDSVRKLLDTHSHIHYIRFLGEHDNHLSRGATQGPVSAT